MAQQTEITADKKKQAEGAVKKLERQSAITALASLSGASVSSLSKKQLDDYLTIIGQLIGLVDDKGRIK